MNKVLIALLLLGSAPLWGFIQKNDFQVWEMQTVGWQLTPRSHFKLTNEFRWGDNASSLYFVDVQPCVIFQPCDWLELTPGYRQIFGLRIVDRKWVPVYNPLFDITFKLNLGEWKLHDRNRIDYLIFRFISNQWQYRHRLKLISPWKIGKIGLNPHVSNEFFFRETAGYSQNRFAVGGKIPLNDWMTTDIFYMLRHLKLPTWRHQHVLGIYFYYSY